MKKLTPTAGQYISYQSAFDYWNMKLFENTLPNCILNFDRHRGAVGTFRWESWKRKNSIINEISINPDHLNRSFEKVMQTLVHEMTHLWQYSYGKFSRYNYHNKEFAAKMETFGLITTDTGKAGGVRTGRGITQYSLKEGWFMSYFTAMPDNIKMPWQSTTPEESEPNSREITRQSRNKNKIKYYCRNCPPIIAWGKSSLALICGLCSKPMLEVMEA
ncbi:hypothetical protein COB64_04275 [Candidatus Wolfebacteria bacterium]|nr:MAG: hypothetical protein COB64_04275 [Candidatus Wolfebacteria bacterium]